MIGFYYGTVEPGSSANEGIYFVNKEDNKYSIYIKKDKTNPAIMYGEVNEVGSNDLNALWSKIGDTFVSKTFKVAGLSLDKDITYGALTEALELQALAYKNSATGTITDYVVEVEGFNYTPTGNIEVILGYEETAIVSSGKFTPLGEVIGTVIPQGQVNLKNDSDGFEISGTVSTPEIVIHPNIQKIKQITNAGTLPTYQPAVYKPPELSSSKNSFATQGMIASIDENNSQCLKFTFAPAAEAIYEIDFNKGEYTNAQFTPGELPVIDESLGVVTHITNVEASQPIFKGNKIKVDFNGVESNIEAIFEGIESNIAVQGVYDKATISTTSFTGQEESIQPILKKENKTIIVQ